MHLSSSRRGSRPGAVHSPYRVLAALLVVLVVAACSKEPPPLIVYPDEPPPPVPGRVGDGAAAYSEDNRVSITSRSGTALDVSIREMEDPPPPPPGWRILIPVYDIVIDPGNKLDGSLEEPLVLRFVVPGDGPAAVIHHNGDYWEVVDSERDLTGVVTATVTDFSPYTVAKPFIAAGSAVPTVTPAPRTPRPQEEPTLPGPVALHTPTIALLPTFTPGPPVNLGPAGVTVQQARQALVQAAERYRGKPTAVAYGLPYTGESDIELPRAFDTLVSSGNGPAFFGVYNAVNQVITTIGGPAGSLTLLVEPRAHYPATADEAREQIAALFAGVTAEWRLATEFAGSYVFTASVPGVAIAAGFTRHQDVALAYFAAGTGAYAAPVSTFPR